MVYIEPLEDRIAPASIVTFTDVDGDKVTIKVSRGDLASATIAKMASGVAGGEQLLSISLTDPAFEGADLSITAVRDPAVGGDGFVNVGQIIATGRNLGTVLIRGDLGQIDAGNDNSNTPAIKSLTVNSLGEFGAASGSGDSRSQISGALGALSVKGNVHAAYIEVGGGDNGTIGGVKVTGSIIGGSAVGSGSITATGAIGPVTVGGNIQGSIGPASGQLFSNTSIKSVTLGGSLLGGSGAFSGLIQGDFGIGPVKIAGRVEAFGIAPNSARIESGGTLGPVTIGRDLIGSGDNSAQIHSILAMGAVKIGGDLRGGSGANSGRLFTEAGADMGAITIGGSLLGGTGTFSASLNSGGNMGLITIRHEVLGDGEDSASVRLSKNLGGLKVGGNFKGGDGDRSARVLGSFAMGNITIGGNLFGGGGAFSGTIAAQNIDDFESMGVLKIAGNVVGGTGSASGGVSSQKIASITIGGSILGGSGPNSANVDGGFMSFVKIGGSVDGRGFNNSAVLETNGFVPLVSIGGFVGGATSENGGALNLDEIRTLSIRGDVRGGVVEVDEAKSITIGGSVLGGAATRTGWIHISDKIGSIKIGGDLRGGSGTQSGKIEFFMNLVVPSLTIGGGIFGGTNNETGLIAGGDATIITKLAIGGDIVGGNGDLVADRNYVGYVSAGSIGTMTVGGSVIAGTNPGVQDLERSGGIGTTDGYIKSLTIKGSLLGNDTERVIISAYADDVPGKLAFSKIVIGRSVDHADILGGFDYNAEVTDDAQMGSVVVGGDWIASNLVCGVDDNDGFFGDANDTSGGGNAAISSKIASIVINGAAFGTPANVNNTDRYAITAEFIGSLKIGSAVYPLNATPHDNNSLSDTTLAIGPTGDFRVREL